MPSLFDYQVVCHRDTNRSFLAYVPAMDGCQAIGSTPAEAHAELRNVEGFAKRGESLPQDVELTAHAG